MSPQLWQQGQDPRPGARIPNPDQDPRPTTRIPNLGARILDPGPGSPTLAKGRLSTVCFAASAKSNV